MISNNFLLLVGLMSLLLFGLLTKESHSFTILSSSITSISSNTRRRTIASKIKISDWNRLINHEIIDTRLSSNAKDDGDIQSGSKKRRRRKDGKNRDSVVLQKDLTTSSGSESTSDSKSIVMQQEKNVPKQVTMQIMDVRDVVSGKTKTTATTTSVNVPIPPNIANMNNPKNLDYESNDDDYDEYEYYYEDENGNEIVLDTTSNSVSTASTPKTRASSLTSSSPSSSSSSLDDILADARRLRQEQKDAIASGAPDPEELSIPKLLKGAISNIVTVDFFLVCGLLLWFLAGIFCSYVLKDDTVQIAFNMQFERVVQPALGILMIGAAAGAVFKEPDREDEQ
jgi:hypothetical protein